MPLNFPAGEVERVSFGSGILKIGAPGSTPTVDVGFARGATLAITRSKLDLKQGNPSTLVRTFCNEEDVSLSFTGLEWKLQRLKDLLGAGTYAAGPPELLKFGGTMDFAEVALLFEHRTPTNGTLNIRIFRSQGQGELNINFGGDDFQEFPYQFRALPATTDWAGAPILSTEALVHLVFQKGVAS